MSPLCKYKNIFGAVGTGVHSIRLGGVAIVDVAATIIGGILIAHFLHMNILNMILFIILFFCIGILVHWMFCVDTTLNKLLLGQRTIQDD